MKLLTGVLFVSLCRFLLFPGVVLASDAIEKKEPLDKDRVLIESLIEQLRSPNKDPNPNLSPLFGFPNPNLDPHFGYPKEYDFTAQEKVYKAYDKLVGLSKRAFPILIEHVKDKGYSFSVPEAVVVGHSVGVHCFMIIEEQVDVAGMRYKARKGSDGEYHPYRNYFSQFSPRGERYTQEGLKRWWKEHQHQSLQEMQIDVLRWAISHEKQIGFPGKKDEESYLLPLQAKLRELTKE